MKRQQAALPKGEDLKLIRLCLYRHRSRWTFDPSHTETWVLDVKVEDLGRTIRPVSIINNDELRLLKEGVDYQAFESTFRGALMERTGKKVLIPKGFLPWRS